ncbi:MAG: hypothetical protein ACJ749_11130 [Flavisolibacter sp.]
MLIPGPIEFRAWQIEHYTQRLSEAATIEARSFLRRELYNLKKQNNDRSSIHIAGGVLAGETILE